MKLVGLLAEIIVMAALLVAIICNILLITSCEFFEFGDYKAGDFLDDDLLDQFDDALFEGGGGTRVENTFTLGLFKYGEDGSDCKKTTGDLEDAALNCAKVCAVIALLLGFVIVLAAIIKQYLFKLPLAQMLLDGSSILTQIFLVLVYVAWGTEACDELKCEWGQGSKYLFGTQLCYFIAGIFTRCMRDPCYERRRDEEPAPAPKSPKPVKEAEPKQEELEVEKGQGSDNEDEEK